MLLRGVKEAMEYVEDDFCCIGCLRNQAIQHNGGFCADCIAPLNLVRHKIQLVVYGKSAWSGSDRSDAVGRVGTGWEGENRNGKSA